MGICNKLAGAIAPLVLAYFIFSDGDAFIKSLQGMDEAAKTAALDGLARRVIGPYAVMTIVLFLLGLLIRFAPLPEIESEEESEEELAAISGKTNIFQFPHLILGVLTLFFYVGIEVIAGDTIIRYGMSLNLPIESAKYFTSLVLVAMVIGYIIGITLIPKVISQRGLLAVSAVSGLIFTILAIFIPASDAMHIPFVDLMTFKSVQLTLPYTVLFIALLGLSNAIVWPAVWPLAIHGLGRFIKTGSALLIMGIAGGALLPLLWGYLSDAWGAQNAYWIAVPCYLFILYFAVYGHKVRRWV
jgi:fucose permease